MLNLAYIKRESSGLLSKPSFLLPSVSHSSSVFSLNFSVWEMTPCSGDEIPGGISAGCREAVLHLPFKGRQTATASHRTAAVPGPAGGRSGVAGIDNVVEK